MVAAKELLADPFLEGKTVALNFRHAAADRLVVTGKKDRGLGRPAA